MQFQIWQGSFQSSVLPPICSANPGTLWDLPLMWSEETLPVSDGLGVCDALPRLSEWLISRGRTRARNSKLLQHWVAPPLPACRQIISLGVKNRTFEWTLVFSHKLKKKALRHSQIETVTQVGGWLAAGPTLPLLLFAIPSLNPPVQFLFSNPLYPWLKSGQYFAASAFLLLWMASHLKIHLQPQPNWNALFLLYAFRKSALESHLH